jgi:mono/diheme cytochrome c family protein
MRKGCYTLLVALPAAALILASTPSAAATTYSKVFEGRKLFTTYCLVCHGPKGDGKGPLARKLKKEPADLTDRAKMDKRSDLELFKIIETGRAHEGVVEGMPKWGTILPNPSIEALAAYVRFLHRSKYPLIGDPELGRTVYADYCASCHGTGGRGDGPMTKVLVIPRDEKLKKELVFKPADHTSPEVQSDSNEYLLGVVRDGRPDRFMPGWKDILSEAEIRGAISYIRLLSH